MVQEQCGYYLSISHSGRRNALPGSMGSARSQRRCLSGKEGRPSPRKHYVRLRVEVRTQQLPPPRLRQQGVPGFANAAHGPSLSRQVAGQPARPPHQAARRCECVWRPLGAACCGREDDSAAPDERWRRRNGRDASRAGLRQDRGPGPAPLPHRGHLAGRGGLGRHGRGVPAAADLAARNDDMAQTAGCGGR